MPAEKAIQHVRLNVKTFTVPLPATEIFNSAAAYWSK